MDIGALSPFLWAFEFRENLMEFYERVCGARLHANFVRPGGIMQDLPDGMLADISEFIGRYKSNIDEIQELLTANRIFKRRTVNIGVVTKKQVQTWNMSGAMARASGLAWDLRKAEPYEVYDELDFSMPIGVHGDTYDRFLVRINEMVESLRIMEQCIEKMPTGAIKLADTKLTSPSRGETKGNMESLIHHFKFFTEGPAILPATVYAAV